MFFRILKWYKITKEIKQYTENDRQERLQQDFVNDKYINTIISTFIYNFLLKIK